MGTTQEYLKRIADKLAFLESRLQKYGQLHLYDENKAMEDVVCRLLNLIYGYELQNLNAEKENYPGIDLGDKKRRIAVQVTSDNSREKVKETIQKFHANNFSAQYDRLIIFVLGTRKSFSKEFETGNLEFSAENDILDFNTLVREVKWCNSQQLKKIHRYLQSEFPEESPEKGKKWVRWLYGLCFMSCVLCGCLFFSKATEEETAEYGYDTYMDWLTMDEAASVLSNQSQVYVYKSQHEFPYFYQGAALTALFTNLEAQDRCISRFTVYAENIQEDYSPQLQYAAFTHNNLLRYECHNEGWGGTGDFTLEYVGMKLNEEYEDQSVVDVSLRSGAVTSWEFPSIEPGETAFLELFSTEDFLVEYKAEVDQSIQYDMEFLLRSRETDYQEVISCLLFVSSDGIQFQYGGGGLGSERHYIVFVETSEPNWQRSYPAQQLLPGNKTVRLPIYIVPEMSCTMTVRIEFETSDGEIIEATPLENARFYVPYYTGEPEEYVDGSLLDWETIDGQKVLILPENSTACFPFVSTGNVVAMPSGEAITDDERANRFLGSISQPDPSAIPITTAQELAEKLAADPAGSYVLTNDIDLSTHDGVWESLDFFEGTLDGQGYFIRNLCGRYSYPGLFKEVDGAVFQNIGIEALVLDSTLDAAIVASRGNAVFRNCYITCCQLSAMGNIGGLIASGVGEPTILEDVYLDVVIRTKPRPCYSLYSKGYTYSSSVGGVLGSGSVEVSNCSINCDISIQCEEYAGDGYIRVGGIAGDSNEAPKLIIADTDVDCDIRVKTVEAVPWELSSAGRRIFRGVHVCAGGLIGVDDHEYGSGNFTYNNQVEVSGCNLDVDIALDVYGCAEAGGILGSENGMNSDGPVVTIDSCMLIGNIYVLCHDGSYAWAGGLFGFHPAAEGSNTTVEITNTNLQCQVTAEGGYYSTAGGTLSANGNGGIAVRGCDIDVDLEVVPGVGKVYIDGEEK